MNQICAGGIFPVQPALYGPGSGCCDAPYCTDCYPQGVVAGGPGNPSIACAGNGMPARCDCMSADIPWMMPKAYACGRVHKCADDLDYPNLRFSPDAEHPHFAGQLDDCSLPGRAPHTVTCVHALGITSWARDPLSAPPTCSTNNVNENIRVVDYTDLMLRIEIPLELIVEDCCGKTFCLRSFLRDYLRIPMCGRAETARQSSDMLYLKSRVHLCEPYGVPPDISINASHSAACSPVPASGAGIPLGANGMRLEVLMEACIVRLMPYGVLGYDPTVSQPPAYL
ncbi:MAG: hypothetical protein LBH66_00705 [Oscillospiraceae bacterium]|nr:hypothetical protein [Oscillospiraceae bacterium]